MSNAFVGQISMFGGNFAPRNFALCNGQLVPIAQNQALFSLIGTAYGGDGVNTFGLPDLRSRLPVHQGQGSGLSNYVVGQTSGSPTVTIDTTTMPSHNHALNATVTTATTSTISGSVIPGAAAGAGDFLYAAQTQGGPALVAHTMAGSACGIAGGSQPHTNLMPSLCISFIICLQGIFPSRN